MSTTVPTPEELRADIRARAAELRALRRLLRFAEAAEAARQAREARRYTDVQTNQRQEAAHA